VKSAIFFLGRGVKNCEVSHCRFADSGGDGIMLMKECQDNLISGNEFTGLDGTAVRIYDSLAEGVPDSSGNRVKNNVIHRCGTIIR
jgi:hypothetical protein